MPYGEEQKSLNDNVTKTIDKLESMIDVTISDLLDELFMDLEGAFAKVLTRNWIDSSESINTICVTVEDYTQDYVHLRPDYFNKLVAQGRQRATANYLRRLLSRSLTLSDHEERLKLANQIVKESETLKALYDKMGDGGEEAEVISDAIPFVAEILRLTDPSMMSLELGTLVNNFPDVTRQHLMAILYLRSDVKGSASEIISETLGEDNDCSQRNQDHPPTIFSRVKL